LPPGRAKADHRPEDVFNKVIAEIGGEAVFQPPAAGSVADQPLQVALVGAEPERQLAQSKAWMR